MRYLLTILMILGTFSFAEDEKKPFLGVSTAKVSDDIVYHLNLKPQLGLMVFRTIPQSPAAKAGIKKFDILFKINSKEIVSSNSMAFYLKPYKAGDKVVFSLIRAGKKMTLNVELGKSRVVADNTPSDIHERYMELNLRIQLGIIKKHMESLEKSGLVTKEEALKRIEQSKKLLENQLKKNKKGFEIEAESSFQVHHRDHNHHIVLKTSNKNKNAVVKNLEGDVLFNGPINTAEERKKVPADILRKIEEIEKKFKIIKLKINKGEK